MFENCKAYNRPESRLFKDSARLQKAMSAKLEELEMDDEDQEENESKSPSRSPKDQMKKKLRVLYNSVLNFRSREGIQLIGMFMEKPSRKDYPDYYEVITNPIDMTIINDRIKSGQYKTEDDLITDMKLMFNNCRQYNEEGSDIYHDANTLERILISKAKDMGLSVGPGRRKRRTVKELSEKLKILFETLRDHKDNKGRQLSLIFLRLPNPKEFPDYFEVSSSMYTTLFVKVHF
jgi:protein polybromo-1